MLQCDPLKSCLPHPPRALGQLAAQCLFFPPHFWVPSLPQSASLLGEEEEDLHTGYALTLLSSFCYWSTFFSPKDSNAQGLYQRPCLLLTSCPCKGLSERRLLGLSNTPHLSVFTQFQRGQSHPWLSIQNIPLTLALLLLVVYTLPSPPPPPSCFLQASLRVSASSACLMHGVPRPLLHGPSLWL